MQVHGPQKHSSTGRQSEADVIDPGLEAVFRFMLENKNGQWNSVELNNFYNSCIMRSLSRQCVIRKVRELFSDVIVPSSPGYASVIAFRSCASVLKIVKDEKEHEYLEHKTQVARCTERECKEMKCKRRHYDLHIDKDKMDDVDSPILSSLLSLVSSPKFNKTFPAAVIRNIVISHVTN